MRVILRTDVANLGKKGDVLDVSDGYARNYLVPRAMALRSTEGAITQAASMRRSRDVRDTRERLASEEVARQLVPQVITLAMRAGPGGRLFGSVTAADLVQAVRDQTGIELDRRKIQLEEPLRELGEHEVKVRLHTDVEFVLNVVVATSTT